MLTIIFLALWCQIEDVSLLFSVILHNYLKDSETQNPKSDLWGNYELSLTQTQVETVPKVGKVEQSLTTEAGGPRAPMRWHDLGSIVNVFWKWAREPELELSWPSLAPWKSREEITGRRNMQTQCLCRKQLISGAERRHWKRGVPKLLILFWGET